MNKQRRNSKDACVSVLAVLFVGVALQVGAATWAPTAAGTYSWDDDANWNTAPFPNGTNAVGDVAVDLAGAQAINFNRQITLGSLIFGDTSGQSGGQTIQAGTAGSLVMCVSNGYALIQRKNGNTSKPTTISADIRLDSTTVVDNSNIAGAYELILSGAISGNGGLIKTNAASSLGLFLGGYDAKPNTYAGPTVVAGGTLYLNKNNVLAVPGDVLIKTGTMLGLERNNNLADTSVVQIEGSGIFRLSTRTNGSTSDTIGGLASDSPTSAVVNSASSGTSVLTVNDNSDRIFAGVFRETNLGRLAVVKKGTGTWTLSGTSTNAGAFTVDGGGGLAVNGALCFNPVILTNNGALGGSGVISGLVTCARGILAPGTSGAAGTLTLAGGLAVVTALTNQWQLAALSESAGYDQIAVAGGTAALGSSGVVTLDFGLLSPSLQPTATPLDAFWLHDRSWTILAATGGAITGQFSGISNGTGYAGGKGFFSLSGGNGSDVVLHWQSPPPSGTKVMVQ